MNDPIITSNLISLSPLNILLTGVGGQGTILASNIVAEVGVALGYDVKKAEVHGMSQRGGNVVSQVRWGRRVFSPIISPGEADFIIAFEKLEALRALPYLRPRGQLLVDPHAIPPVTVTSGDAHYPDDASIKARFAHVTPHVHWIPGAAIAEELGNAKAANVVLLGAFSALLNHDANLWLDVIRQRAPSKYVKLNERAFWRGREIIHHEKG
jgi:indolepyruvate ferredoxin oxidoreductase beta subunit